MVTIEVKKVTGIIDKSVGLIGKKYPESILFQTRFGIHTFGLKFPIDILVLDNDRVVYVKENLFPNRFFIWNPKYKNVIELPQGFIKDKKITKGSTIKLVTPLLKKTKIK